MLRARLQVQKAHLNVPAERERQRYAHLANGKGYGVVRLTKELRPLFLHASTAR